MADGLSMHYVFVGMLRTEIRLCILIITARVLLVSMRLFAQRYSNILANCPGIKGQAPALTKSINTKCQFQVFWYFIHSRLSQQVGSVNI